MTVREPIPAYAYGMSALPLLFIDHIPGFVLGALTICAVSGWLLAHVLDQARNASGLGRLGWLAGAAIVSGSGVWTTHFMAMLGYRSDLVLTYDLATTLASAGVAILAVGVPLAASVLPHLPAMRAALGALAGLGIGAMHITGMVAIEGCAQSQSVGANVLACGVGAVFLGLARALPRRWVPPGVASLLVVLAVCGTHFVSIAGTLITGEAADPARPNAQVALSLFTAVGAATLLIGAVIALVTARRFDAQKRSHARTLTTALHNMSNGILQVSGSEIVELYNRQLCTMLRLHPSDLAAGMTLSGLLDCVGRANGWDEDRIARVLANHRLWMATSEATHVEHAFDDGRILSIVCQPVRGGALLTYDDVTKTREAQADLLHLALHDPLTGLANRRGLGERLTGAFAEGGPFALLLLDLDRFKVVNDTFGHRVGDGLLVQVGDRLRAVMGETGFVSRLGGDEMALILPGDEADAMACAQRVVAVIARPFAIDAATVVVGASVGVCPARAAGDPDDLMQRADIALYEAKRRGRGQAAAYETGMMEAVAARHALESDLRTALAEGQFRLAYQPIQSLADDRVIGFEALIRWTHPTLGTIAPTTFVPLAEETGLIVAIGRWVLMEACRQATRWPADRHVAVNVSAVQFRSPLLLAHIIEALAASGLPPERLEIELTETALVEDGAQTAQTLAALRHLGITIAMDDFGTGYSSLAHLRDLPLDRIKIDRSFVATALDDKHARAVVKAVAQMGRDMGIATLAEGVERADQLELLRSLGCDAVQGYLIGRPDFPTEEAQPELTARAA